MDSRQFTEEQNRPPCLAGRQASTVNHQRLALTAATAQVLKNGLYLLGIATLEQM